MNLVYLIIFVVWIIAYSFYVIRYDKKKGFIFLGIWIFVAALVVVLEQYDILTENIELIIVSILCALVFLYSYFKKKKK